MDHTRDLAAAVAYYTGRLLDAAPLKFAAGAWLAVVGWLTSPGLAQAAAWLLIADWITGMAKAMIQRQVNSDAGVRGATKTLIYAGVVLAAHAMMGAGEPLASTAGMALFLMASTEALSNLENIKAITGHFGIEVPILDRLIAILRMRVQETQTYGTGPLIAPYRQGVEEMED